MNPVYGESDDDFKNLDPDALHEADMAFLDNMAQGNTKARGVRAAITAYLAVVASKDGD